ncbi:MAG TPA: ferritin-like domain-containing protein [Solirubrobacteraceae bacterium]|nr:ferritin-like domain-containing protein [Solirubrobacteraceae bacterium]
MSHPATEEAGPQPVGALEVLARDPSERKKFLKMVGKGVGGAAAASSLAAFIAACGSSSSSSSSSTAAGTSSTATSASANTGDIAIVNYALTLEYLETEFYKKVIKSGLFSGKVQDLLKVLGAQEQTHVNALKATVKKLGGTPATKPVGKFPLGSATAVAKLAATVENLGAAAYLGQAGNIVDPAVLGAALSIHTVEARHAAILNELTGQSITPDGAFAKPMTMSQVLAAVKPFIA